MVNRILLRLEMLSISRRKNITTFITALNIEHQVVQYDIISVTRNELLI